jgi:hypothetical protein
MREPPFIPPAPPRPGKAVAAEKTLERLGYQWRGGAEWAPPLGEQPDAQERKALEIAARHSTPMQFGRHFTQEQFLAALRDIQLSK